MDFLIAIYGLYLMVIVCNCQMAEKLTGQNPCASKTSCRECIQTPTCAWCFQPDFGDRKRCYQPSLNSLGGGCSEEYEWNPANEEQLLIHKELTRARGRGGSASWSQSSSSSSSSGSYNKWTSSGGSSSGSSSSHGEIVQLSPQRMSLKLRIKEEYRIQVRYSQAEDYPVDLYYLMDLSNSMKDDKDKLSSLGDLLAESMRNITSNFRLGFGSFVDKVVMPYVNTVPKNLIAPCEGCATPYGYRNVMRLSQDTSRFAGEVRNASVSGNLDAPEGGFDAIMQAVVCRKEIGWREKARRLLVFSTDAGFHYAGDGKLGGIVKPNDGSCHLDTQTGLYTHSSLQDYPSISQINLKVKENAINVIFAVTQEQISVYNKLRGYIEGSSSGVLSNDSSNVVDLVKEQYNKISSSVEMKDNATSAVKITYYSECLGKTLEETNKCNGLKVGDTVTFTVKIEVTQCPKDPREWKQVFQLYPVGINENLVIDLEMLCDCPCERPGHSGYKEYAEECDGHGTLKCGICECDPLHFGRHCECSSTNIGTDKDFTHTEQCRPDNTSLVDCSGRGTCYCGQCECETRINEDEVISGQFCECDNFSCDRHGGLLCSGSDHGVCVCGKCECLPGWGGSACDCRIYNDTCIAPGSTELCSGHGICECGQCKCNVEEEGRYSGRFCEKCPTCPDRCLEYKECVQCQMYKTGQLTAEECAQNCTFVPESFKTVEADEKKDEILCTYYDKENCRFQYVYTYDERGDVVIRAQQERECPPKVFMLGIVLGVIAAIVLLGLALLLIWKAVTTIHDRREYAKFEKERTMARWDTGVNPIYKQATSTFKNPTYAAKNRDIIH